MECLDEETILAFCHGGLAPPARSRAEQHIASCDECRALVSAVVRSSMPSIPPPSRDPAGLAMAMAPTTPVGAGASHGPAVSPVQPGDVLAGKFEVERVLGAGGMGIVVAARHIQLDQRVALKFLLPVACEVPGAVARFLREGKAAARITSEHVARVMDTGVLEGGAPYLVMEYLEGSDLGAWMQDVGKVAADDAIEYVLQACEAIVEAHELGVVHRDLKPANLFLAHRADGSPLVKVLDFGISKLEGGGSRSQLTSASVLMGSPRYMSPEQMLSAKDVDARTDVWALGVILFELVTGKPVWTADTVQGLCGLITSAPAPALRTLAPEASAELEDVIARCLTKELDRRLGSIADLALALEPIAPPSSRVSIDRILRVAGRLKTGVSYRAPAAAAAAAAAPAAAITAAGTTSAVPVARRSNLVVLFAVLVVGLLLLGLALNAGVLRRSSGSIAPPAGSTSTPTNPAPQPPSSEPAPTSSHALSAPTAESPSATMAHRLLRAPAPSPITSVATALTTATARPPVAPPVTSAAPIETSRALIDRK